MDRDAEPLAPQRGMTLMQRYGPVALRQSDRRRKSGQSPTDNLGMASTHVLDVLGMQCTRESR